MQITLPKYNKTFLMDFSSQHETSEFCLVYFTENKMETSNFL